MPFESAAFHVLGERFEFRRYPGGSLDVLAGETLVISNAQCIPTLEQLRADCIQWLVTGRASMYPREVR